MGSSKSFLITSILCLSLGIFGIHRLYVGKYISGILMMLTLGGLGIWIVLDLISIVTGNFTDNKGEIVSSKITGRIQDARDAIESAFSRFGTRNPSSRRTYRPSGSPPTAATPSTNPRNQSAQGTSNVAPSSSKSGQYFTIGCLVVVIAIVALVVTCVVSLMGPSELSDAEKAIEAEEKRKGFHCMSPWDGNHDGLEDLVRARLKDPDSMETIGTRITPVDANGNHRVILEYRARNSFGGMVVEQALGSVDNETCEAIFLGTQ